MLESVEFFETALGVWATLEKIFDDGVGVERLLNGSVESVAK